MKDEQQIIIAREYFIRADQGCADLLDLFTKDVEFYFPKFGFGHGPESFFEMVKGFEGILEIIRHDYDTMNFISSTNYIIVEGTSHGKINGKAWEGGVTPGGRFCNVFKFRDDKISSLHVYLDPDYTGEDENRFRWGKNRQW
jgi:ketosteroid isomerase-like protein